MCYLKVRKKNNGWEWEGRGMIYIIIWMCELWCILLNYGSNFDVLYS